MPVSQIRKGGRAPQIGYGVSLSPEQEYKYSWSGAADSESALGLRYAWLPLPVPERGSKCFEDPRCRVGSAARLNRIRLGINSGNSSDKSSDEFQDEITCKISGSAWLRIRSGGNLWACDVWQQVRRCTSTGNSTLDDGRQWIPIKVHLSDQASSIR